MPILPPTNKTLAMAAKNYAKKMSIFLGPVEFCLISLLYLIIHFGDCR